MTASPSPRWPAFDWVPAEEEDRPAERWSSGWRSCGWSRTTHCTPVARQEIYALVAGQIPVIASLNAVQSMNPEPYNLDWADVQAIAASGGVVGVIFMPYWLEKAHPGPGLDAIVKTMETVRDWSGGSWDHVAIGTDFDGFTDLPDDCDNASKLPVMRELLASRGLSPADAEAVLGGNARRILRAAWR